MDFSSGLRALADDHGAVLIFDEIYSGLNRTGKLFACEHWGVYPDLICLGKALTGGFPLSACVGASKVMDAWPNRLARRCTPAHFSATRSVAGWRSSR